jgi:hypothetical protein
MCGAASGCAARIGQIALTLIDLSSTPATRVPVEMLRVPVEMVRQMGRVAPEGASKAHGRGYGPGLSSLEL